MWRFKFFFVRWPWYLEPSQQPYWHFIFFWCVHLRNRNFPRKPCGVSSFSLCQPARPDPSQKTMSLFKLFWSTCAPLTLPENHVSFHCFLVARPTPPRTFPAHHVPFQVFALLFKATAFRNLNYNCNKYVRRGEGLQKHLMKPNALAQSSSHALADKGWPGR